MIPLDLSGKLALITGVGDNVGFAWYIAKALQAAGARRLDRVGHRLDRAVADGMRRHLQAGIRGSLHQRLELVGRRAPHAPADAHDHALRAAVDEHLDRTGAHDVAAEASMHAKT